MKVSQLVGLNREQITINKNSCLLEVKIKNHNRQPIFVIFPERITNWLRKYLATRNDEESALFINYRGPKDASRRLTVRSVEKIVKAYCRKLGVGFSITPEVLRKVQIINILQQIDETEIITPLSHNTIETNKYNLKNTAKIAKKHGTKARNLSWTAGENFVRQEIEWLKQILDLPFNISSNRNSTNDLLFGCNSCLFRKIAILIVSGRITATEIRSIDKEGLWNNLIGNSNISVSKEHGKEWHQKMMKKIVQYFQAKNYKVVFEPILNYGRADLGINIDHGKTIYVEVGTVSLTKLLYNLFAIKDAVFLVVPSEEYLIEFKT